MNLLVLTGILVLVTKVTSSAECPQPDNNPQNYLITYVSGKCWYLLKTSASFTSNSYSCKNANGLDLAKIENEAENSFAQGVLSLWGISNAFIGLTCQPGGEWTWDGDMTPNTGFNNLVTGTPQPPVSPGPTVITTKRTTAGPGHRRRPTSVVFLLDSSVYSTIGNIKNQLTFYQELGQYITDRGDAEFALYQYGCDMSIPSDYVDGYNGLVGLLNSTLINTVNQCTRVKAFAPNGLTDAVDTFVSYYYANNPVYPKKYQYLSVLFFSSVNDPSLVSAVPAMSPMSNEQVITIAVGRNAASLSKFSIPAADAIRINDFSDMSGLVQKVDKMMFPAGGAANFMQEPPRSGAIDLSQYDTVKQNAIMSATDGLWYPVPNASSNKYPMLCTGPPVLSPVVNPTAADPAACMDHFIYYQDLPDDFCFKTSDSPRNFSSAQSDCVDTTYKHPPQMVTVENLQMQQKLSSIASQVPHQGMFWIGLMYNSTQKKWIWQDGTVLTESSFTNWRPGYPRLAEDSNCVAYVINDDKWINTNCEKQLTAICAIKKDSQN